MIQCANRFVVTHKKVGPHLNSIGHGARSIASIYKEKKEDPMKWRSINFLCIIILVLAVVLCGNFSYAAQETTIQKILANRDSYDGQEVSVSGTVSKLKLKTLKGGNDYTTFSLLGEAGRSLNVFVWGHSKVKMGQRVKVTGTYQKVKRMGQHTFYNEIEAIEIK
jgi:hypothetical protein